MAAPRYSKCNLCKAIVFTEDQAQHVEWHENTEAEMMAQVLRQFSPNSAPQLVCTRCHAQVLSANLALHTAWHAMNPTARG